MIFIDVYKKYIYNVRFLYYSFFLYMIYLDINGIVIEIVIYLAIPLILDKVIFLFNYSYYLMYNIIDNYLLTDFYMIMFFTYHLLFVSKVIKKIEKKSSVYLCIL